MNARRAAILAGLLKGWVLAFFMGLLAAVEVQAVEVTPAPTKAGQVRLAWNPVAGSAGYMLYNSFDGVNFQAPIDTGATNSISLAGLRPGTTNYFSVAAYDTNHVVGQPSAVIPYLVPGAMVIAPRPNPSIPTAISFSVTPGRIYQVQASSDLANWATIWQTTATSNQWVNCQDALGGTAQMRFYRLTAN